MQPLVLSPKVWMWKPRLALASLPVMSQVMVVGEFSSACSKVTVPETLESPRRTLTRGGGIRVSEAASGVEPGRQRLQQGPCRQTSRDLSLRLTARRCAMRLIGRVGLLRRPFAGVEMIDRPVRSIKVAVHATEELAQTSAGPIVFRNPFPTSRNR